MPTFRSLCLACLAGLCLSTSALAGEPVRHQVARVDFTPMRDHGVPLVKVTINDQLEGTFLIDTGASACIMSHSFAAKLGLKTDPATISGALPFGFASGGQQVAASVKSVQMGAIKMTDASFIVINDNDLFEFSEQPVDGIIGGPILSNFAMFVDFPGRYIYFVSPGNLGSQQLANVHLADAAAIPLSEEHMSVIYEQQTAVLDASVDGSAETSPQTQRHLDATVDSHVDLRSYTYTTKIGIKSGDKADKLETTIDTGSPDTSIPYGSASKLGLQATNFTGAATMYNGSAIYGICTADQVSVGGLELPSFAVSFPTSKDSDIPPLLGEDVLSYCVALFDFPAKKLYLKPVLPPLKKGQFDVDLNHIDVARLQGAAADIWLTPSSALASPDAFDADDTAGAVAVLQAKMKGDATDADRYAGIGDEYLADRSIDKAQAAYAKAAELYAAQGAATVAKANLAVVLASAGKLDAAETMARKVVADAPADPKAAAALAEILRAKAQHMLTGDIMPPRVNLHDYTEYTAAVAALKKSPPPAAQLTAIKQTIAEARSVMDKAVALAASDPAITKRRADFVTETALGIDMPLRELAGEHVNIFRDSTPNQYFEDMDKYALARSDAKYLAVAAQDDVDQAAQAPGSRVDFRGAKLFKSLPRSVQQRIQAKIDRATALAKSSDPEIGSGAAYALAYIQYRILDDKAAAEATLKPVVLAHPEFGEDVEEYSKVLSSSRRYDDLAADIKAALKVHETAQLHLTLARAYLRGDHISDAASEARAAVKLKPDSFQCNLMLASILMAQKQPTNADMDDAKAALARAEAALGNLPDLATVALYTNERCIFEGLTGDATAAAQAILTVLDKDRTNTQARNVLGALLL